MEFTKQIVVLTMVSISRYFPGLLKSIFVASLIVLFCSFLPFESPREMLLNYLAASLSSAYLATQVHRFVVQEEAQSVLPKNLGDVFHYMFWLFVLQLPFAVLFLPLLWMPNWIFPAIIFFGIPLIYLTSRMSLILANRVVGRRDSFVDVWRWSGEVGWQLTAALFFPPIAINILMLGVPNGASTLVNFICTIFFVGLLSNAYKTLAPNVDKTV